MSDPNQPLVLMLSDDLIFNSRVMGTAKDMGAIVRTARNSEVLLKLARESPSACVIIDLANPGLRIGDLAGDLKQLQPAARVIAYGSHVDVAGLQAAREAGCDVVLPRSQFVANLPADLARWLEPKQ